MAFIRPIIKGGGTDVSDTTAVASDVLASKDFYLANGTKATGTIPTYAGSTEITENATLETEGKYLASDIVVNVSGGTSGGYVRPTGSFNGDTLAQNAVSIEVGGVVYDPLYVLVAMDTFKTVIVQKSATGRATGGDAFVFSDEPSTLYVGNTTHEFDPAFDSATSENWKSRYIIVYGTRANKENANGITVNLYNYRATYEMVGCSGTIFSSTSALFGCSGDSSLNLRYINIENSLIYNNVVSITSFCSYCYSLETLNLPNLTTVSGNSFCYRCYSLTTLNLPNLESVSSNSFCSNCYSLTTLNLPNLTTVSGSSFCFNCYSLTTLNLPLIIIWANTSAGALGYVQFIGLPTDFDIDAVNLTGVTGYSKSLAWFHHLATQLKDNSGGTAKTMVLGATNIALIPSADATTISAKNWTLS